MKNLNNISKILLAILCFFLMNCKKEGLFDGKARVKGTIYFKNILKNTADTAKNASITLQKKNADASEYYSVNITNGTYDIIGLRDGDYTLAVSYSAAVSGSTSAKINYKQIFEFSIAKDELKTGLDWTLTENTVSGQLLLLQVVDLSNNPIRNAQVCIYTDPLILTANQNKCTGSIKSAVSNDLGIVTFADLGSAAYHVTAFTIIGMDTVSNRTTAAVTTYNPSTSAKPEVRKVTISQDKPALTINLTDANGLGISGAKVSLYNDISLIAKYGSVGTGSIKSGMSDANGNIVFTGLQSISYYAYASKQIGNELYSNLNTILTPSAKLTTIAQHKLTVVLQPEKPVLEILVVDANGAHINNAQVCVYSDLALITKFGFKCTGSLKSGNTDQNGSAVFPDMQTLSYYISASRVIGKDTISNAAAIATTTPRLGIAQENKITVVIK